MKTAFIHGIISPHDQHCTAFVIEGHYIVYVGHDEHAIQMADQVIDLQGKCVLPGFNDSHMHLLNLGSFLANLDLTHTKSSAEIINLVQQKAETSQKGTWITGRGFNQDNFIDGKLVTKEELDEVSVDHPIMLTRCCGHLICVNSKALELAGITENTQIEGGTIDFEKGHLTENANELIKSAREDFTVQEIEELLIRAGEYCHQYGITSVQSDDFMTLTQHYDKVLQALINLDQKNEMKVRLHEQCQFPSVKVFDEFLHDERHLYSSPFVSMGPLKLLQDGSLGARTAALSRPYSDSPSEKGMIVVPEETLEEYLSMAKAHHMPSAIHVIGDEACETVLNAYQKYNESGNPLRNGLVHVQVTRSDQLKRIADMNLHNYIQTIFVDYDARIVKDRIGDLEDSSYAFKTLYDTATISNGSDAPVELPDVLKGIECAVSRRSITDPSCTLNMKEALSVKEAIDSFTTGGAYASFEDYLKGKIQKDMLADFVILDQNPMDVPIHKIHEIQVLETWLDGKRVYSK